MNALVRYRSRQSNIPAAGADEDCRVAGWHDPALGYHIPDAQVVARQGEGHIRDLSWRDEYALEALQIERRTACGFREGYIELRNLHEADWSGKSGQVGWTTDLVSSDPARVLHRESDSDHRLMQPWVEGGARTSRRALVRRRTALDRQVVVLERRVREPEAKLIAGLDAIGIKVTVVDEEALRVVDIRHLRARLVKHLRRVVVRGLGNGVREATAEGRLELSI